MSAHLYHDPKTQFNGFIKQKVILFIDSDFYSYFDLPKRCSKMGGWGGPHCSVTQSPRLQGPGVRAGSKFCLGGWKPTLQITRFKSHGQITFPRWKSQDRQTNQVLEMQVQSSQTLRLKSSFELHHMQPARHPWPMVVRKTRNAKAEQKLYWRLM